MFRPSYLQKGDKVALVSPAGALDSSFIEHSCRVLEDWGLVPVVGQYALAKSGYFAGEDELRIKDMQAALDDNDIKAIFCNRGGYGCMRIVERLDYSTFQGNPKWIIGFSDITVFHSKLNTLGIESIHGPMPKTFVANSLETLDKLREFLFGKISSYKIPSHPLNRKGVGSSELIGGNLTLLHCLRSTALDYGHRRSILFIEDVGEKLYSIDRMLHSFKLSGHFDKLSGLIVGDFSKMHGEQFGMDVENIIKDAVEDYNFPVCFGFPAGHEENNMPLIMGATVELIVDTTESILKFKK